MTLFIFIIINFFLAKPIYAAPAPWEIAINTSTKECAGFTRGDERTSLVLPQGWTSYRYEYDKSEVLVNTSIGICRNFSNASDCCNQLNYKYVSANIGKPLPRKIPTTTILFGIALVTIPILAAVIFFFKKKK